MLLEAHFAELPRGEDVPGKGGSRETSEEAGAVAQVTGEAAKRQEVGLFEIFGQADWHHLPRC